MPYGTLNAGTIAPGGGNTLTIDGSWTAASQTCANLGTVTTADINGGTIDGTTIGTSSHTTGKFTTCDATTDFTIGGLVVTDGQIADTGTLALVPVDGCTIALGGDAGDDFNIDGGKFVVEGDTGNVGIGDAAPGSTLVIDNVTDAASNWVIMRAADAQSCGIQMRHEGVTRWHVYTYGTTYRIGDTENDHGQYLNQNSDTWNGISSDERKKSDWVNFTGALDKINSLTKIGNYRRIEPTTGEYMNENIHTGLSAQEIEPILPHSIDIRRRPIEFFPDDETEYLSFAYQDVFVLGIKALQELSAKHNVLEARVLALESA